MVHLTQGKHGWSVSIDGVVVAFNLSHSEALKRLHDYDLS